MPVVAAPIACAMRSPSPIAVPPWRGSSFSGAGEMYWRTISMLAWKPPSAITTAGVANVTAPSGCAACTSMRSLSA